VRSPQWRPKADRALTASGDPANARRRQDFDFTGLSADSCRYSPLCMTQETTVMTIEARLAAGKSATATKHE
jgi:hypothetical protein